MKKLPNLIFFGTEQLSASIFESLIKAGFLFEFAVTKPPTKRGRGQVLVESEVEVVAKKYSIPVNHANSAKDLTQLFANLKSGEYAGLLVAFGLIIPSSILEFFEPYGITNLHPSLLPKYRGPSPVESAILNGDSMTGVSIMKLSAKMDEGPVYAQTKIPLPTHISKTDLYETVATIGAGLLIQKLPRILDGSLKPKPQNDEHATYCQLIQKQDGILRPQEFSAAELEHQIRAYVGFPKSRTEVFNHPVIVTKAKPANTEEPEKIIIKCKNNTYLEILEVVAASGKTMSAEAFMRGYRKS